MKIKYIIFSLLVLLGVQMFVPSLSFAQEAVDTGDVNSENFQLVPCNGVDCEFKDIVILFNRIVKFLLFLSIPLILGMIIYTAFLFLTSNGNPGQVVKAKKMFQKVAIGIFFVLAAYLLVYTFLDTLLKDNIDGVPKEDVIILNLDE